MNEKSTILNDVLLTFGKYNGKTVSEVNLLDHGIFGTLLLLKIMAETKTGQM